MTGEPLRFSVIVCSWQRPLWLKRCLLGLRQLDYAAFEIIVVADPASLDEIEASGLKTVPFDTPNLSKARNAGIAAAGGEVCAFIDDDAVPEPLWLAHLAQGFETTGAGAAVGYVRGRNGISYQSRVTSIDCEAETHLERDAEDHPFVPRLVVGRVPKLVGTNMAIKRDILLELCGFDPQFKYFLEDADLSIRVSDAGHSICVIPDAEVHHSYASSSRRNRQRMPLSLYDIGRSTALFLRRHGPNLADEIHIRVVKRERTRLLRHMVLGNCEPRDVKRLLGTLEEGWQTGMGEALGDFEKIDENQSFMPVVRPPEGHSVQSSLLLLRRRSAIRKASIVAQSGRRVSLFSFSLTPIRHQVSYTSQGVWLQRGGLFGRSDRGQPLFRWCRFAERVKEESRRVAFARGLGET